MKAIIFGGTGMVGSEVLDLCLNRTDITQVVTIGRKKTGTEHSKLKEIQHDDFLNFSSLNTEFVDADICYYCIGVYQGQVSKDEFWKITVDYLHALLSTLEKASPNIRFCLFSAQGANQNESSFMLFANAKGRAEKLLNVSKLQTKHIFRPGYIAPSKTNTIQSFSAKLFYPIYKVLPLIGIDADKLAKVIVEIGVTSKTDELFENSRIRKVSSRL